MNIHNILCANIDIAEVLLKTYLSDITDQELTIRVAENANSVAWQLGHLICSNNAYLEVLDSQKAIKLPDGFRERYSKDMSSSNDILSYHSKILYLSLFEQQFAAAKEIAGKMSADDFDRPSPEKMRSYAPNFGVILLLIGNHLLMHLGQIVVLRRSLGKPVLI